MTARALTRPFRVVRARTRTLAARRRHRRELADGRALPQRLDHAPIFVLGAPRSGTTLAYQLLVEGLDVGWLANAHAARPADVVAVERAAPPRAARHAADYESEHGATSGDWGPSEAGEYWYRFFPRDRHQQGDDDATDRLCADVAAGVRAFAAACDAPVVFKNTLNSLRVPVLARALPEARFVLVERDLADNARSLLVGRLRRGDIHEWWGARPDGAEPIDQLEPAAQVAWQVRRVTDVARDDLDRCAPGRWITVRYDELCDDPRGVLACTQEWLAAAGIDAPLRDGRDVSERFDRRGGGRLDDALETQLAVAVQATSEDAG